jgi:hypothetical protein
VFCGGELLEHVAALRSRVAEWDQASEELAHAWVAFFRQPGSHWPSRKDGGRPTALRPQLSMGLPFRVSRENSPVLAGKGCGRQEECSEGAPQSNVDHELRGDKSKLDEEFSCCIASAGRMRSSQNPGPADVLATADQSNFGSSWRERNCVMRDHKSVEYNPHSQKIHSIHLD